MARTYAAAGGTICRRFYKIYYIYARTIHQEPGTSGDLLASATCQDDHGNTRNYSLVRCGPMPAFVVSNSRAQNQNGLQIVTVMPWGYKNQHAFNRRVRESAANAEIEARRLNRFYGRIILTEYFWANNSLLNATENLEPPLLVAHMPS